MIDKERKKSKHIRHPGFGLLTEIAGIYVTTQVSFPCRNLETNAK
jgi:hypothetical protein